MPSWKRALLVLWIVQFLTTLAMNLGLTFVPFFLAEDPHLHVTDPHDLVLYTSLILAGPFFTTILATPLWGWVADRSGRKRQVVRAAFGLGLTQILMALARTPEQLVAIRLLQGMISGVLAACLGLMAAMAPEDRRGRAIATLQSAIPAGQIFGPVFGGFLASAIGYRPVYWVLGSLVLLTGLLALALVREEGFVPRQGRGNPFVELWAAMRHSARDRTLRSAFAILLLGQVAWTTSQVVSAIYAGKVITAWAAARGIAPSFFTSGLGFAAVAMTVTGLSNFLMSLWWGRAFDRGQRFLTPMGASVVAVSLLTLAFWPPWWLVLGARVGMGGGLGGAGTLQLATISARTPAASRGQFMGLATSMTHVGNLVGFVAGGALARFWGESGNFALSAALYVVVALVALRLERQSRLAKA